MRPLVRLALCFILTLAAAVSSGPAAMAEDTGTLVVTVENLDSDAGVLRFVMFASGKDFLNRPLKARLVEIKDGQAAWSIDDLAYGSYAVLVHHDLNANGKMERHWYGKPKEPTGTSNNPRARMGPPLWKQAKFELSSPTLEIAITVQ